MGEKGEASMPRTEAYKEHIEYTFNAFCRVVIYYAAINARRDRDSEDRPVKTFLGGKWTIISGQIKMQESSVNDEAFLCVQN